ncbi:MAG: hypothetical protein H6737_01485 [Alphaproteobacteria bacterium]|nr:hypothetical protein [Alphaproteobacteria bacterium]
MNPAVLHLPDALTRLAPELVDVELPDETRADCANCPLAGQPFLRDVRCCTYEPALPSFLAGRALLRENAGSARVRARIRKGTGLTPLGIQPDPAWSEAYVQRRETDFGRNRDWACPYWVEGPLSCSIWPDRNAVCRSWHCKHTEGFRGHAVWVAVRKLAAAAERRLAAWCAEVETAPEGTDEAAWVAYYTACARRVENARDEDLDTLRDSEIDALRESLAVAVSGLHAAIPDILGVEVKAVIPRGEQVELVGYTPWNSAVFPRSVFALLAQFDGDRPTGLAVQQACESEPSVDPGWVRVLWDIGVLRAREAGDVATWGFGGADLTPETLMERFDRSD